MKRLEFADGPLYLFRNPQMAVGRGDINPDDFLVKESWSIESPQKINAAVVGRVVDVDDRGVGVAIDIPELDEVLEEPTTIVVPDGAAVCVWQHPGFVGQVAASNVRVDDYVMTDWSRTTSHLVDYAVLVRVCAVEGNEITLACTVPRMPPIDGPSPEAEKIGKLLDGEMPALPPGWKMEPMRQPVSVKMLELKEFLYASTTVSALMAQVESMKDGPAVAQTAMNNVRALLRLHRFDVMTWLMGTGVPLLSEVLADSTHPEPGAQTPDRPADVRP